MEKIILGLLFIFFKTNLDFMETGLYFYVTNLIGYVIMYFGIQELSLRSDRFKRIRPFIVLMIAHSVFFIVINGSGNSIQTIALSSLTAFGMSFALLILAVAGGCMVFYVIHLVVEALQKVGSEFVSIAKVEKLLGIMIVVFVLSGIVFFSIPSFAFLLTAALLIVEITFLLFLYSTVRKHNVISA